jgi:Kef-type K+ transport system membrane component KefB
MSFSRQRASILSFASAMLLFQIITQQSETILFCRAFSPSKTVALHPSTRIRRHKLMSDFSFPFSFQKSTRASTSLHIHCIHHDGITSGNDLHWLFLLLSFPPLPDLGDFISNTVEQAPFAEFSRSLFDQLDIGSALDIDIKGPLIIPDEATGIVMESIGQDLLIFLAASVVVTPISNAFNVTPILGYLIIGALLGPHGLDLFANSKADVELGDFGIIFLLFSEGLEVSTSRLKRLANFLPLGLAQMSLCAGVLSAGIVLVAPALERFLPLDAGLIDIQSPAEALVLALAGTLSTSAFVFPVLKEREWEDEQSGQAATSILLLQDLAVAPLLVLMPYVVGQGPTDYSAIAFLTAKATIGFGSVIVAGSFVLRRLFDLIATTRSTETFVALCLLVSVGIGEIAKGLGLTDTAGAFAAGVLLANTNYRAQIQADILPFKGILLGIFFMGAGSSFDTDTVLKEFPTIITGTVALVFFKAVTLFLATRVPKWIEPNRLPVADGLRLALLLSGGGEFAFVVLALAEKLDVLPTELGSLLTAIVLITMAITPFLGELAEIASRRFEAHDDEETVFPAKTREITRIADDAVVICGYGEIGQSCLRVLDGEYRWLKSFSENADVLDNLPVIVAFDSDPSLAGSTLRPSNDSAVLFGDGSNPSVLKSSGISNPSAIFVSYEDAIQVAGATARLRAAYENAPIYARAQTRREAQSLKDIGATEVVIESDELPRSATAFIWSTKLWPSPDLSVLSNEAGQTRLKNAAAIASGLTAEIVESLFKVFLGMDQDLSGKVERESLIHSISKTTAGIHSDDEIQEMIAVVEQRVIAPLDLVSFCRFYAMSSPSMKAAILNTNFIR